MKNAFLGSDVLESVSRALGDDQTSSGIRFRLDAVHDKSVPPLNHVKNLYLIGMNVQRWSASRGRDFLVRGHRPASRIPTYEIHNIEGHNTAVIVALQQVAS